MSPIRIDNRRELPSSILFCLLLGLVFTAEYAALKLGSMVRSEVSAPAAFPLEVALLLLFGALLLFLCPARFRVGTDAGADGGVETGPLRTFCTVLLAGTLPVAGVRLLIVLLSPPGAHPGEGAPLLRLLLLLSSPLIWLTARKSRLGGHWLSAGAYLDSSLRLFSLLVILGLGGHSLLLTLPLDGQLRLPSREILFRSLAASLLFAVPAWALVARPLQRLTAAARAMYMAVYDQVVDAVVVTDAAGTIRYFNVSAEQLFGYRTGELAGGSVARLFEGGEAEFRKLVANDTPAGSSSRTVHKFTGMKMDGTPVRMELSVSTLWADKDRNFLFIMRDISDRLQAAKTLRASEKRFRQIFEQSDDAIIFLHPRNHSIIDVNSTTIRLFGFSRADLLDEGLELLFPCKERGKVLDSLVGILPGDLVQFNKLTGCCRDGSTMIVSLRVKVAVLGNVPLLYATLRDVTERVKMEAEAQEIQSKLIQTNRMTALGLMVSGVAHEINNPNNYILTNAQILERSWQDSFKILQEYYEDHGDFSVGGIPFSHLQTRSRDLFSGLVDGSRRIREIVSNLKGFARQESVSLDGQVDVNQVAEAAIAILQHEIIRYTRYFSFEPMSGLPQVRGNRQQLGQVLVNLLMNACQSLPDRNKNVKLKTWWDQDSRQVVVSVEDEGLGMTEDTSRLIMEPFFTTKLDSGGTGLGLSICRTIVKDHQGTLSFRSRPGVGTTFFVRLPALATEEGDAIS